jgi:hypothetical protein
MLGADESSEREVNTNIRRKAPAGPRVYRKQITDLFRSIGASYGAHSILHQLQRARYFNGAIQTTYHQERSGYSKPNTQPFNSNECNESKEKHFTE